MGQVQRQFAVVGHEQQTLGIGIQSTDRINAGMAARNQLTDGLSSALILERGHVAARLVEHEVNLLLGTAQRLAVDQNDRAPGQPSRPDLPGGR